MRLTTDSLGLGRPQAAPMPLVAENPAVPLDKREAELAARLRALASEQASIGALVAELSREGVPVNDGWRGVFDDSRVQPDPQCDALEAAAEQAARVAEQARARANQARASDLERRLKAADEMAKQVAELAAQARTALENARAAKARTSVAAPAPAPVAAKPKPMAAPPPPPKARSAENRVSPRVKFEAKIDFESDHNFFTGFSSDISEGGLFVATVNLLPIGSRVDVSFSIGDGQPVTVSGQVRWVRDVLNDMQSMPGMGIQFDALPEPVRGSIHSFIAARDPLFFD